MHQVYSCIKGTLVEVNEVLLTNPSLLLQKVSGYINILHFLYNDYNYNSLLAVDL